MKSFIDAMKRQILTATLGAAALVMTTASQASSWGLKAIEAEQAQAHAGKHEVIVAVIDTGVDLKSPLLRDRLWRNPGETGLDKFGRDKATNGVDDDGNGLIDDVHGYNFAAESGDVHDRHGHGTHIARIIQQVAPQAKFMILKYYEPGAHLTNLSATVKAIEYAVAKGAHLINYSGGGNSAYPPERRAIEAALKKNILFIAAAGNDGTSNDAQGFYPSSYDLPNILAVASLTPSSRLVSSSNFGARKVHIAAPGFEITSSLPDGRESNMTGTSQATAFVTGAAALILSQNPNLPFTSTRRRLEHFAKKSPHLRGRVATSSSVNAFRALTGRDTASDAFDGSGTNFPLNSPEFLYPPVTKL